MVKLLIAIKPGILSTVLAETFTQHEVHSCHTGTEALALLESLRPDVFLVELSLPVISGLSVLQKACYKPPVILALTDLITESVLQAAANTGVQEVILLPCTVSYLATRLKDLIQKAPTPEV